MVSYTSAKEGLAYMENAFAAVSKQLNDADVVQTCLLYTSDAADEL